MIPPQPKKKRRVADAMLYINNVKRTFEHRPEVYDEFLEIMNLLNSQQIDASEVFRRLSVLFEGQPKLLSGFDSLMLEGSQPDSQGGSFNAYEKESSRSLNNNSINNINNNQVPTTIFIPASPASPDSNNRTRPADPRSNVIEWKDSEDTDHSSPTKASQEHHKPGGSLEASPSFIKRISIKASKVPPSKALSFINEIKSEYRNQPQVYSEFLEHMNLFNEGKSNKSETMDRLTKLFQTRPRLLVGLNEFILDDENDDDYNHGDGKASF